MEVGHFQNAWDGSNTFDNSNSIMLVSDSTVSNPGYYQLDKNMIPLLSPKNIPADHEGGLQMLEEMVQLNWQPVEYVTHEPAQQLIWEPPGTSSLPADDGDVLQMRKELEQLNWEPSEQLSWEPLEQLISEPSKQMHMEPWENTICEPSWQDPSEHIIYAPVEELHFLPTIQSIPEIPTDDQSAGESHKETGVDDGSGEEVQHGEEESWDGDIFLDDLVDIDEASEQMKFEPSERMICEQFNGSFLEEIMSEEAEDLQCLSWVQPTDNQCAGESHKEMGPENGSREEDQYAEEKLWDGDIFSNDQVDVDEATSSLSPRPSLPPGEHIGVTYHKKNKQWESHLWIKGQQLRGRKKKGMQIFLGNFDTENDAKVAHDRAAIKLGVRTSARGKPYPLNFPEFEQAGYIAEHADWTPRDFVWKIRRLSNKFSKGKSSLKGVSVRKRSVKRGEEWVVSYESKLSVTDTESGDDMKRTYMLGSFDSEEKAGQAYDQALLYFHRNWPEVELLRCITNYRPSSYSAEAIEAMGSKLLE